MVAAGGVVRVVAGGEVVTDGALIVDAGVLVLPPAGKNMFAIQMAAATTTTPRMTSARMLGPFDVVTGSVE